MLLDACQAMSQMNGAVIEPACECVQEVGAVKSVIGSAVTFCCLVSIVELEERAGLHVARVDPARSVRDRGHFVANTDALQRLDGLRADINRGADLAQRRSDLEHCRVYPKIL